MIVLKLTLKDHDDYPPMYLHSIKDLQDYEATVGQFLGIADGQQDLEIGTTLLIEAVEMSDTELAALPSWEM